MPADTSMVLDESFIKPFQFISPEMQSLQNDIGDFLARYSFGAAEPLKEVEDPRQDPPEDNPAVDEGALPLLREPDNKPLLLPPPADQAANDDGLPPISSRSKPRLTGH